MVMPRRIAIVLGSTSLHEQALLLIRVRLSKHNGTDSWVVRGGVRVDNGDVLTRSGGTGRPGGDEDGYLLAAHGGRIRPTVEGKGCVMCGVLRRECDV